MLTLCTLMGTTAARAVDGVLEINQTCAAVGCFPGDGAGFPVTIGNEGSYVLTSDLESVSNAIELTASDTTIDLNGFTVKAASPAALGGTTASRVTVRNGRMDRTDTSNPGPILVIDLGSEAVIEDVKAMGWVRLGADSRVTDCSINGRVSLGEDAIVLRSNVSNGKDLFSAISAGARALIAGNQVSVSEGGISAGSDSRISGNNVTQTGQSELPAIITSSAVVNENVVACSVSSLDPGIYCSGCVVEANVVEDCGGFGLFDPTGTTGYKGNRFDDNNGGNTNPQTSGGLQTGINICGGNTTCP
jgi:hypothetical protein